MNCRCEKIADQTDTKLHLYRFRCCLLFHAVSSHHALAQLYFHLNLNIHSVCLSCSSIHHLLAGNAQAFHVSVGCNWQHFVHSEPTGHQSGCASHDLHILCLPQERFRAVWERDKDVFHNKDFYITASNAKSESSLWCRFIRILERVEGKAKFTTITDLKSL